MILKGDQSTIRSINRALVLNLLRQHGALGRNELAERTRLSSAAVTGVVAELIEQGWVIEGRSGPPAAGVLRCCWRSPTTPGMRWESR